MTSPGHYWVRNVIVNLKGDQWDHFVSVKTEVVFIKWRSLHISLCIAINVCTIQHSNSQGMCLINFQNFICLFPLLLATTINWWTILSPLGNLLKKKSVLLLIILLLPLLTLYGLLLHTSNWDSTLWTNPCTLSMFNLHTSATRHYTNSINVHYYTAPLHK